MIDRNRLEAIIKAAGQIAAACWPGAGNALVAWEKTPGSPVCEGDLAVDAFLKTELLALLPGAGWLSEETPDSLARCDSDWVWLVDPIDGTRDFINGRPGWAVSVALVHRGQPVIAALDAPAMGHFWWAQAGAGATRNGIPLVASTQPHLVGARVPARVLPLADAGLVAIKQPNSIALRMAMVASGEADLLATWRWGFEWDIAAAALIAAEAGALVSDALGAPLVFNKPDPRDFGVLVAGPALHPRAVEQLRAQDTGQR
ncbi:MAG TPA: 3'(2'),5'-bisphosphate nucleotidase CysQ [Novosphingobium sp.]|nr:3'(2'),5'-bisphosphate nucleotidase CysQ [Novosphingobium sp.]